MVIGYDNGEPLPLLNGNEVTDHPYIEYEMNGQIYKVWLWRKNAYSTLDTLYRDYYPELIWYWITVENDTPTTAEIAWRFRIHRWTLDHWRKIYPDFDHMCELAKTKLTSKIERQSLDHIVEKPNGSKVNTGLAKFFLAALDNETYGTAANGQNNQVDPNLNVETPETEAIRQSLDKLEEKIRNGETKSHPAPKKD